MKLQVSILPNPFDLILNLEVIASYDVATIVRLFDHKRHIVKMISWSLKKGVNKITFEDLSLLPPGDYVVDISDLQGENLYNTKLLKIT